MKQGRTLLLLLAAALVLGGAYAAVRLADGDEEAENINIVTPLPGVEDVQSFTVAYGGADYTLINSENGWTVDGEPGFPLDQSKAQDMADALRLVCAERELNAPEGQDYGLEPPVCEISVTASNGENCVYRIGNYNETAELYYLSDGDCVYLADSTLPDLFFRELYGLIELERVEDIYADEINKAVIVKNGETLTLRRDGEDFKLVYPTMAAADSAAVDELLSSFTGLYFYSCAAYGVDTDAERALYGLDAPSAEMTVYYSRTERRDSGKTDEEGNAIRENVEVDYDYTLVFGADTGDGYTYVQPKGSDRVYRASVSESHIIIDATAEGLYAASD